MSIGFTMRRITPGSYEAAVVTGVLPVEFFAEDEQMGTSWGVLAYILANGQAVDLPLAAQAISGGTGRAIDVPEPYVCSIE